MKRKKTEKSKKEMPEKNEQTDAKPAVETTGDSPSKSLAEQIRKAAENLFYTSETDAEITPFVGKKAEVVNKEELLKQTGAAADSTVEEKEFAAFFARLTEVQDWYGDEEKETVRRFIELKKVLENNIRDLKVFRIGKIELDVYVVGLDAENTFLGIKTKAVET